MGEDTEFDFNTCVFCRDGTWGGHFCPSYDDESDSEQGDEAEGIGDS